jgi:hypothetical protein
MALSFKNLFWKMKGVHEMKRISSIVLLLALAIGFVTDLADAGMVALPNKADAATVSVNADAVETATPLQNKKGDEERKRKEEQERRRKEEERKRKEEEERRRKEQERKRKEEERRRKEEERNKKGGKKNNIEVAGVKKSLY